MLLEHNKHILLAEKYGLDTVACYTVEPLATDSDDEKLIRKAVKESKQLRDEKKRLVTAKQKAKGGVPWEFTEQRVSATTPPAARKFPSSREVQKSSGDVRTVHDSSVGSSGQRNKSHDSCSRSSSPT